MGMNGGELYFNSLADDDYNSISLRESGNSAITLCFSGIGHAIGGVDIQSIEFFQSTAQSSAMFVIDKQRTWGNELNWSRIREIVDSRKRDRINAIGNSMGGFSAILSSSFLPVDCVVAFVPQYSVDRRIINETRFGRYISKIARFNYPSLENSFREDTQYYIFFGVGGPDDMHLEKFPSAKNIHKILFTHQRFCHHVAQSLKADGKLYSVIRACFAKRSPNEILQEFFQDTPGRVCLG